MASQTSKPYYELRNPFDDWTIEHMQNEIAEFTKHPGLGLYRDYFERGGLLNLDPNAFERDRKDGFQVDDDERKALRRENNPTSRFDRFRQTKGLYLLVALCSAAAAVQGWDESAVNGAQIYYAGALKINPDETLFGLVNSAPYLFCTFSCLLTYPLNYRLGRRGAIFITCLISFASCLGQAFVGTWQQLFAARLVLGLGIGPKSATVPIYSAECAPANVRGALVMMWQMWTAFGIMLGYASGVVFHNVAGSGEGFRPTNDAGELVLRHDCLRGELLSLRCSWNWRLMLASPMVLPLIVAAYVYTLPESPRWLLNRAHKHKGEEKRYEEAFDSLVRLRPTRLQAARDLFLIHHELLVLDKVATDRPHKPQRPLTTLFTDGRSARALLASVTCMFFQQFCGVNVIAYYSTIILLRAGSQPTPALLASLGFGVINFVFALPAFWTIDTFGRRSLLLATFPFMAVCHALISIAFGVTNSNQTSNLRIGLTIASMYLFGIAYSPGEGPVPFVYAAESMPLYNRDIGMGLVTAINWFLNFVVAISWPPLYKALHEYGAFIWYAGWCIIGEIVILLVVPETKGLSLEELSDVFRIPLARHARFGIEQARAFSNWCLSRNPKWPVLLEKKARVVEVEVMRHGFAEGEEEEGDGAVVDGLRA